MLKRQQHEYHRSRKTHQNLIYVRVSLPLQELKLFTAIMFGCCVIR
jgi:hypothetical protein